MNDFAMEVLSTVGTSAVILAFGGWLAKSAILERLRGSIQHEYDLKSKAYNNKLEGDTKLALAKVSSDAALVAIEHQVRFSRLHEKRAGVISKVHSLLMDALIASQQFSGPDLPSGETENSMLRKALVAYRAMNQYIDYNGIWLPEKLADRLDFLVSEMREQVLRFGIHTLKDEQAMSPDAMEAKLKAWIEASDYFNKAKNLKRELELEFRTILGAS